ncbi:MAG: hypothetical protein ACTSRS_00980 [Candidatus Helarchaeota archaeon]
MTKSEETAPESEKKGCIICERELVSEEFCKYHDLAYQNVKYSYQDWQKAYGKLSYKEYLQKLIENQASGRWVKEVAEKLLEREGK